MLAEHSINWELHKSGVITVERHVLEVIYRL